MFCLLDQLKLPLSSGGVNVDGFLRDGLKLRSIVRECTVLAKPPQQVEQRGQATLLGMYRWLILSLITDLIAHWTYLSTQLSHLPDWGEAAPPALEYFFPQILVSVLLLDIERLIPLARSHGFDIKISRCKI